jgi:acetyl/propionyl-CoA carboxylase alpha subunit
MKQPQGRRRTQHCVRHLPTVSTTQTTNGDEEREDLPPKAKAKEEERSILLARWAMKRGEAKTNDRHQKAKVRVHYTNYRYLLGLSAASPPPISLYCTKPPTMNPTLRLRTQAIARLSCQRRNLSSSRGQVRRLDTAVRSLGALRLVGPSLRGRQTLAGSSWNVVERRAFHATADLSKEYPEHELLSMPALSPTMEMGTIAEWALKEGDSFGAGSAICSVETDKATMDFEAQDDGFLAKILRQGPDAVDIPCGATIAIVVEDEADVAAFADYVLEAEAPAPAAAAEPAPAAASPSVPAASASTREVSDEFVLLPAARFLAESK